MESPNDPQPEFELRLEKLRLEIEEMKRNGAWNRRLGRYLPVLSTVIPLVALTLTVWQLRYQSQAASLTAQRAFMEPVLTRQFNSYFEASAAAATLAGSQNEEERQKAREAFFRLYWGPLVILESGPVSGAMKDFGLCLDPSKNCDAAELQRRSLLLSSTLRQDLFDSWKLTPEAYANRTIDYQKYREAWSLDAITRATSQPQSSSGPTPVNSPTPRLSNQRQPATRAAPANLSTPRPNPTPAAPSFEKGPTPNPTPKDPKVPLM